MKKISLLSFALLAILNAIAQTITPTGFKMSRAMQPDFNGYNGTNTIKPNQTWKDVESNLSSLYSLNSNTLRYPGGTVANYWNWREGRFLTNYQITSGLSGLSVPQNFLNFNGNLGNYEDDLDRFKTSSDLIGCAPIFNLNIMTSDYYYQLAMLYHAKEIALPVKYVELGNEFYNDFPEHRLVFPSVVDYATKSKDWAAQIKAATLGTGPKIAVVGSWELPISEGRQRVWLDNLMNEIRGNTDIDAVTIHQYLGTGLASLISTYPSIDGACLVNVLNTCSACANTMLMSPFNNIKSLKQNEFPLIYHQQKERLLNLIWVIILA